MKQKAKPRFYCPSAFLSLSPLMTCPKPWPGSVGLTQTHRACLLRAWPRDADLFRHANCSCFCAERLCGGVGANCSSQHVLSCPRAGAFPSPAPPASSVPLCLPLHCQVWQLLICAESKIITSPGMGTDSRGHTLLFGFEICQVLQLSTQSPLPPKYG